MRDARKPVIPLAVEEDPTHVLLLANGEVRAAPKITHSLETFGRMRAGYVCAMCWEGHDESFPVKCKVCSFPMREQQSPYLAQAYQGHEQVGPTMSLADELALLEETEERMKFEKSDMGQFRPQIVVPRSL